MPAARRGGPTPAARRAGVRLVRFLYTDNGGVTRGKATHLASLGARITDGIGLAVAMQAMNMLDQLTPVEGMGAVGEFRLKPDPETFTRIANTSPPGPTGLMGNGRRLHTRWRERLSVPACSSLLTRPRSRV